QCHHVLSLEGTDAFGFGDATSGGPVHLLQRQLRDDEWTNRVPDEKLLQGHDLRHCMRAGRRKTQAEIAMRYLLNMIANTLRWLQAFGVSVATRIRHDNAYLLHPRCCRTAPDNMRSFR